MIQNHQKTQDSLPIPRKITTPSPSTSRAVAATKSSSLDRGFGNKKTPEKPKIDESSLDNPDLGPFLLKLARDTIASGHNPNKALDFAIRASKSFERCSIEGEPSLELPISLHVVAAIYCSLGRFEEAIPDVVKGSDNVLATFTGHLQLGDRHSMLEKLNRSIACYDVGLKIQMEA